MYPKISKKLVVTLAVGAALLASLQPANLNAITITTEYGATAGIPLLAMTEPTPMDIWLEKLAYQESRHREDIKVLDVNGKYSYGCLQFQEATFRAYATKYGFISKDAKIADVIYDCNLQKRIAKLMIAENYYNWQAWYTSVKKTSVGFPPKEA